MKHANSNLTLANLLERGCGIGQTRGLCFVHTSQYPRKTWMAAMQKGWITAVTRRYDGGYGVTTTLAGMKKVHTVLRRHV